MSLISKRFAVIALLIATLLATGPAAQAQPSRVAGKGTANRAAIFSDLWKLALRLLTKEGTSIDPNGGKDHEGTSIDPDGGLSDEGMSIDPDGRT
ncbi:MAG: hypothetical protein ACJ75H_00690 [Thermoanaerobaculia bacterium]